MIQSFKLYVSRGQLNLVLLEYGSEAVTIDRIAVALSNAGIGDFDRGPIEEALGKGIFTTLELICLPPTNLDGACWIEYDSAEGSAKVSIYPPFGQARPINERNVVQELEEAKCGEFFRFTDVILRNIDTVRKMGAPAAFKAAERRDGEIRVEVTEDRRTAYMTYNRPFGGKVPQMEDAQAVLEASKVVFGVDQNRVREIVENGHDVHKQRVAGAKEPTNGQDAKVEYLFDAYHANVGPRIDERDLADFRDLGTFENVDIGTPLAMKTPATPGEEGTDVTGQPIKAQAGRDLPLPKGKNTKESDDDPNILVAASVGAPKLVHGKVTVEDVLVVEDVDFSTGNIDFKGNVLVKGIVNTGFSITAEGDITCKDTVEGADLKAGGNIFLRRGIKGMGKSVIEAGEFVMAHFIERCTVDAGRSVIVDEALIHSQTSATESVEVTNAKGSIFGGHTKAGNLVRASFIGSEMAIKTEIEVGVSPHLRDKLLSLNEDLKKKKSDNEKAEKNLAVLTAQKERITLTEDREQLYQQLSSVTTQLKDEIEGIAQAIAGLEEELQQCAEGRVEARRILYSNVTVTIKNSRMTTKEPIQKALLVKEGPDIVVSDKIPD